MTRRVEWSKDAAVDFEQAIEHITRDSYTGAQLVSSRILSAIDLLAAMPPGRQGRVTGTYEKVVHRTPYIVAYTVIPRVIFVVRIIHASRDWPEGDWPAE